MRRVMGLLVAVGLLGMGMAQAEETTATPPAMTPEQQAAMDAAKQLGAPSEGHQALAPLIGNWTYTCEWWMAPNTEPQSMTGSGTNTLIFGGRFLEQKITGQMPDGTAFEGVGFLGYDNIRKEYQSIWIDNMMTGMMAGTGQFDAATKTLAEQGEFSCPMTGETNRWFRTTWTVVDADHSTYESFSRASDGQEFTSMVIRYTRAQ